MRKHNEIIKGRSIVQSPNTEYRREREDESGRGKTRVDGRRRSANSRPSGSEATPVAAETVFTAFAFESRIQVSSCCCACFPSPLFALRWAASSASPSDSLLGNHVGSAKQEPPSPRLSFGQFSFPFSLSIADALLRISGAGCVSALFRL
jgi:hypothetical protein